MSKNSWRYRAVLLCAVAVALVGAPEAAAKPGLTSKAGLALFRRWWRASCPRS